jgi:outer membrane protein OmpA-like peptidoglycan-associated protein
VSRALALFALAPALATAQIVDVQLVPKAIEGQGTPQLIVLVNWQVYDVSVKLRCRETEANFIKSLSRPPLGKRWVVDLPHDKPGELHWKGVLQVQRGQGRVEQLELDFATEVLAPLTLAVARPTVDLAARKLELVFNRPLARVDLEVQGEGGRVGGTTRSPLAPHPAGEPFALEWTQQDGSRALVLRLVATDPDGFHTVLELYPWSVEIPHEEVLFDTGKAEIRPEERGKLDASLQLISDAVRKYGKWAPEVKLFVAGHTDTVAASDYNRDLSSARARAIGAYFRSRGLKIPIVAAGLGEEALLVATPDETGEPRNRRAEYIVAVEPPIIRNAAVDPRWEKLP